MKLAILAAAGRSGRRITEEALRRGHEVTAFVPRIDEYRGEVPGGITVREKTILDLTPVDLAPFDAVVDCFGVWREENGQMHTETLLHLAGCLTGTGVHLLVIGGAGGLWADGTHTRRFHETPGFPADTRAVSAAQARSYDALTKTALTDYTYLAPNGLYLPDAPRTGKYVLAGEEIVPDPGAVPPLHFISYADFAVAMLDLAEAGAKGRRRLSVYHDDGAEKAKDGAEGPKKTAAAGAEEQAGAAGKTGKNDGEVPGK